MGVIDSQSPAFLAAAVGSIFLLALIIRRRYFSSISDVPGPFIGSFSILWQIWHTIKGHTEEETIALHQKCGDFVRISHKEVSVSHPDAVKALLVAPLWKSDWYRIFSLPDSRYVNQMSEVDPARHIHKARNVASGYAFSNVITAEPHVDECVRLLERQLDKLADSRQEVHFDHWFNYFGFDVMGEVTFSRSFGFLEQGKDVGGAIANTRVLGIYISIVGHVYWMHDWLLANPIIGWLNLQPSMHIFDTCMSAIKARSASNDVRRDMIEQWKDAYRKHPDRMEEKEITAGAVVNCGAGADTISATLQAFFYYLLQSPDAWMQLRDEVDSAMRRSELSHVVSHAEAQKLTFLQACIKETLRFHTPVGFGLPRVAPKGGVTVAGRLFNEGTVLSVNPWVVHRNREIFGEDAHKFNPNRWLDNERAKIMNQYMIPFGAGYNQCPGRHLAHMEVSKATATLIRDFDIERVEPDKPWRFETHFTSVPYGWPCRLKKRNRQ